MIPCNRREQHGKYSRVWFPAAEESSRRERQKDSLVAERWEKNESRRTGRGAGGQRVPADAYARRQVPIVQPLWGVVRDNSTLPGSRQAHRLRCLRRRLVCPLFSSVLFLPAVPVLYSILYSCSLFTVLFSSLNPKRCFFFLKKNWNKLCFSVIRIGFRCFCSENSVAMRAAL